MTLSLSELTVAGVIGVMRQVSAIRAGRVHRHGYDGDGWNVHINGAAAEMVVARHLDHYWCPLARNPAELEADVGDDVQVRSTDRDDGCLIVHDDDPDDHRFYLVVTHPPQFRIAGWLLGRDAKRKEYWRTDVREPAYFAPQSVLHDVDEEAA